MLIETDFNALRSERVPKQGIEAQWRLVGRFYNNLQFLATVLGNSLEDVMALPCHPLEAQLRDILLGQAGAGRLQGLLAEERNRANTSATRSCTRRSSAGSVCRKPGCAKPMISLRCGATLHALPFRRQLALAVAQP